MAAEGQPLLTEAVWQATPPAAPAVIVTRAPLVALEPEVARLAARVRELAARWGHTCSNSSRPPSSAPPGVPRRPAMPPSGRPRGGQRGHVAHQRALVPVERVDQLIDYWPATCTQCQVALPEATAGYLPQQVTDLPRRRARVTEHRMHQVVCPAWGGQTRAPRPPEVPVGAFGPGLQATVARLSGRYRLSRREVADLCGTLLGVPLCVGSVDGLCQATATALATPVAAVTNTLAPAPVARGFPTGDADETPWRQAGQRRWLWVVRTALATVFTSAPRRGSQVITGLLGEAYAGTLVSDRYSAYAWLDIPSGETPGLSAGVLGASATGLPGPGGTWWVAQPVGTAALAVLQQVCARWHQFRAGRLDRAALHAQMHPVQEAFGRLLDREAASVDPQTAGLCQSLHRLWPALWTFVEEDGVAPTNNVAEQALRPAVLWRKGSFGTQSDGGARFVERLLTVTATCRHQGRSVLDYLTAVCTATQLRQPAPSLLLAPG